MLSEMDSAAKIEDTASIVPNLSADELRSLRTGTELQDVLDRYSEEIEQSMRREVPVYVAEFPTGEFNAMAYPVPAGTLILVNTGLMMLVYRVCKIVSQSINIAIMDAAGNPKHDPPFQETPYELVVEQLAECVLSYLHYGNPWTTPRNSAMSPAKSVIFGGIVQATEKFVLLHEYGHFFAGHFNTPKKMIHKTHVGAVNVIAKSYDEETRADLTACLLLVPSTPKVIDDHPKLFALHASVTGPFLFFALDELISKVTVEVLNLDCIPISPTHPPSSKRAQIVHYALKQHMPETAFDFAQSFLEHFEKLANDVVLFLRSKIKR